MNLIKFSLKRPVTTLVIIIGLVAFSLLSAMKIPIDIFPSIDLPTIYVAQPYGGMSPSQMEGLLGNRYEDSFLYVSGIKKIEVKNIQGMCVVKLSFYEGTNMAQAAAEVTAQVNRAMAFMPPGTVSPTVLRYDAGSLPIGQLVFSAPGRSLNELQDVAQRQVRPMFSSIPGVSSPPPFGANSRTIVVQANPELLRTYGVTPDEVVKAIAESNKIAAAGSLHMNDMTLMVPSNTTVKKPSELLDIPLRTENGNSIYIRDVASVVDGSDVVSSHALVNGKRAVYIPVLKRADASTWSVVQNLKAALPRMQAAIPDDVKISYEFDQSKYVINAVKSLISEASIGALLTGLMVLLFLGDKRSSVIVILTIPIAILSAVLFLSIAGQTINIMTLSGLALAVGVLVDMATVAIENIHQHLEMGKPKARAILDASNEVSFPLLLILFCVLAVFAPSLIMTGVPKSMFMPISLAVGFSMIVSFALSQSLVPILSNWWLKAHPGHEEPHFALDRKERIQAERDFRETNRSQPKGFFDRIKLGFSRKVEQLLANSRLVIVSYLAVSLGLIASIGLGIGKDVLPKVNSGQFQVRLREPDGTRFEKTEERLKQVIDLLYDEVGKEHVAITSGFAGTQPTSYPSSSIFMFMGGSHEALLQVNLEESYKVRMEDLKERLRSRLKQKFPEMKVSFEPIELVDKVMSQGSPTPVEITVAGRDLISGETYAKKLLEKLSRISYLRDVQIAQPLNSPVISVNIDRLRASQMGLTVSQISRSLVAATSSSRYTEKIFWLDSRNGMGYQIQLQIPEFMMNSLNDLGNIPLLAGKNRPVLSDIATLKLDKAPGEYDHENGKRIVTVTANLNNKDLGSASADIKNAISSLGIPPKGMTIEAKGMINLLTDMFSSLQQGLLLAVLVIFLLLTANFQSVTVTIVTLSTIPAVLAGSLLMLLITGSTLNLQSYMGIIMCVGVAVANSILLVTNAEGIRKASKDSFHAALVAAGTRLRPILMTSLAMIVGMIPMAMGIGEAGDQTAPLGRAVIGGLLASTVASLFILPVIFAVMRKKMGNEAHSLDPEDPESLHYKALHSIITHTTEN